MKNLKCLGAHRMMTIGRVLIAGAAVLFSGCETDSPSRRVVIDPGHLRIRQGQQQEFVASGGYDYVWSVEDKELGILTRTPDSHRVIYTAISAPEEGTQMQVLRVTSLIQGAPERIGQTTGTGNDGDDRDTTTYRVSAEAYIVHLAQSNVAGTQSAGNMAGDTAPGNAAPGNAVPESGDAAGGSEQDNGNSQSDMPPIPGGQ